MGKIIWEERWTQIFALLFLVIGFLVAIILQSAFFSYLAVLLGGFLAARLYYMKRFKEPIFPFIMIIIGFLVGYLIGGIWVSRFWIIIFFALGFAVSYYLHVKEILVIFKSEDFIK